MEVNHLFITNIHCGSDNTFIITNFGEVYGFGNNNYNKSGVYGESMHEDYLE